MDNARLLMQAYSQAPWRKQLRFVGMFLLILVLFSILASVYLSVTARAATMGREIQYAEWQIEETQRSIADLRSQIAAMTSSSSQRERADELNLRPAQPDEIVYLVVPGYFRRQTVSLAPPPGPAIASGPGIAPEFNQPLFDWLAQELKDFNIPQILAQEVTP